MTYKFNRDIASLPPSASMVLMDKARAMKAEGIDVINLAGGEPDFDTPAPALLKGIQGLTNGHTHYTAGRGIPALRKRIAKKLQEENSIACTPDEILVTPGGKASIYVAVRTLINPGEEVLIPDPSWVSYGPIVLASGGVPVHVPLTFESGYAITEDILEQCVTDKTRVLIINSPNNPTGRVITQAEAASIAAVALRHDLMIISDEIYEKIIFDGRKHISLASNPAIADRVVTVNGHSKCAAMTGWRLGYLHAAKEVVDQMFRLYQHVFTCLGEYVQEAGAVALDCKEEIELMRRSYQDRRDSFVGALNSIPGVNCLVPEGAFYAWVSIDYQDMDANAVADYLLEKAHVATVPGYAYGKACGNCIRLCFAAAPAELEEAAARIRKALTGGN
ncbi:MAG: pyridoxal phosphate-dependent aminotransferase [Clostridia bacterium]|nr:pyridoxal phosphate-dependent aminotransferase [Clostridia bacterium]